MRKSFFVLVSLLLLFTNALGQEKIKVAIETEDQTSEGTFLSRLNPWMIDAVQQTRRYEIVEKKDARYLIRGRLLSAEEVIIENVPSSDVSFSLRVYEINPKTGEAGLAPLVNSVTTKQLFGIALEKAVKEIVESTTINSLSMFQYRFDFPPLKKSSSLMGLRVRRG